MNNEAVTTTKIVKTRDTATAMLRKLGINSRDYNLFISKLETGMFAVDIALAKNHLKLKAKTRVRGAPKERRESVSSLAERLILDGKTNEEVWAELQAKFNLDATKKSYPSWYRCRLKRQGKLKK